MLDISKLGNSSVGPVKRAGAVQDERPRSQTEEEKQRESLRSAVDSLDFSVGARVLLSEEEETQASGVMATSVDTEYDEYDEYDQYDEYDEYDDYDVEGEDYDVDGDYDIDGDELDVEEDLDIDGDELDVEEDTVVDTTGTVESGVRVNGYLCPKSELDLLTMKYAMMDIQIAAMGTSGESLFDYLGDSDAASTLSSWFSDSSSSYTDYFTDDSSIGSDTWDDLISSLFGSSTGSTEDSDDVTVDTDAETSTDVEADVDDTAE